MARQSWKIGCVYKTPFRKFGHILIVIVYLESQPMVSNDNVLVTLGHLRDHVWMHQVKIRMHTFKNRIFLPLQVF